MDDPEQSSTRNGFEAVNAMDGDLRTKSVTMYGKDDQWWSCKLQKPAELDRILLYLHKYALSKGTLVF